MEIGEKEKKVLEELRNGKEISTTKMAFLTSVIYYQAESILNKLSEEKFIEKIQRNGATYWKINIQGIKFLESQDGRF